MHRNPLIRRLFLASPALVLTLLGCNGAPDQGGGEAVERPDVVDVAELGYAQGDPDAPIHILEFSDFGCPHCARFALESYPALREEFVETGKVYWQYIPVVMGSFRNGEDVARAAECAGEQSDASFWALHDRLFEEQSRWQATNDVDALLRGLAEEVGLDLDAFNGCMAENRPAQRMWANGYVARQLGIRGTPTFMVNGFPLEGAPRLDQFQDFLRELSPN